MSYDPKTRTIRLDPSSSGSMMGDMGVHFVSTQLDIGSKPDAPASLARDARILRDWLCLGDSELPESAMERIRMAWIAYMNTRNIALPPDRIDPADARRQLPPEAVLQVFDGMVGAGRLPPTNESKPSLARRLRQGLRRLFG